MKGDVIMKKKTTKKTAKKTSVRQKIGATAVIARSSVDNPTLTLVIEFDTDHDFCGLLDTIQEILNLARGDGDVLSAELTNVPAHIDCTKLDQRY